MEYVIIGGDAAGMSAAMQIFKHDKRANITIFEQGEDYSYAQCGLPYGISGEIKDLEDVVVRTANTYKSKFNMNATTRQRLIHIDTDHKQVLVRDLETRREYFKHYDKLLIATGARAYVPNWYTEELKGVFTLKELSDAKKIKKYLKSFHKYAVIVGGGYVALEMAESLRHMGIQVKLMLRNNRLGDMFDLDMQSAIIEEAKANKIEICFEEEIVALHGKDSISAITTNKSRHSADLLIAATGVKPNTDFLEKSVISLSSNGAVNVDAYMHTNVPDVFAAGDCAMQYNRIKKALDYKPLGTNANKQGRIAGLNIMGQKRIYQGTLGTSILRFFNLTLAKTGLSAQEALESGFEIGSETIKSTDIAGYFPNHQFFTMKIIYEKESMAIMGAQIIGSGNVDKRIDVLSTAIFSKLKVQDLEDLDIAYAPPYNSVWDPVQKLARKIMQVN